jgi:hypothetical protein
MARSSMLKVMISSKCKTAFPSEPGKELSEIRKALKKEIEAIKIGAKQVFEVWINEETPPQGGTWDSWEVCLNAVKACDILIVLSNGDAGWAEREGAIGICHAEIMTGLSQAPAKVRLIKLPNIPEKEGEEGDRNKRFQNEISRQSLFRGGDVSDEESLHARVLDAIQDAVTCLAHEGARNAARGKFHSGAALDWTRLDFRARRDEMARIATNALAEHADSLQTDAGVIVKLREIPVLTCVHAIPAAISVSAAREMVGKPFLRDHEHATQLGENVGGPLHLILCLKTATETQATNLLGFPDATIVSAPFGVFVADPVQQVQFAFLTNCRDEANTRHGIQRFFEWLSQTGEDTNVVHRAQHRATIVRAIASVLSHPAQPAAAGSKSVKRMAVAKRTRGRSK